MSPVVLRSTQAMPSPWMHAFQLTNKTIWDQQDTDTYKIDPVLKCCESRTFSSTLFWFVSFFSELWTILCVAFFLLFVFPTVLSILSWRKVTVLTVCWFSCLISVRLQSQQLRTNIWTRRWRSVLSVMMLELVIEAASVPLSVSFLFRQVGLLWGLMLAGD